MTIDIQSIRIDLEKLSETHRANCQRWATTETLENEANHHNIYCDAIEATYRIFCRGLNIPYEPLKREQVRV